MQGNFIAVVGIVRDAPAAIRDIMVNDETREAGEHMAEVFPHKTSKPAGLFSKILNAASGKATPYYKEGVALYKNEKKYAEAIVAFNKALEINDKLPYVWNDLGICYREMKENNNALKSFTRAVELAPDNPELLFNLGETLEMIGLLNMSNKYLDSAIMTFKMVANHLPNNMDAWNHIGICYKEKGQIEESKFYFDRAREIHTWNKHTPIPSKRDS
jgi:tetratricopeptide (TPR) repeat protein